MPRVDALVVRCLKEEWGDLALCCKMKLDARVNRDGIPWMAGIGRTCETESLWLVDST